MELKNFADKLLKPVQWHEGILLSPQHFQQSDCYYQQYSNCLARSSNYFGYGIVKLLIDNAALISGVFKVLKLEAIFEDGSLMQYDIETSTQRYERDIKPLLKDNKTTRLYVSVARYKASQCNFSGDIPRYLSVKEDSILDDNTGENAIELAKKDIKFYLHSQDDLSPKFSSIPVAEIVASNTGIQKTNYIPPIVFVDIENGLYQICATIVQIIKQKIGYIIDKKSFLTNTKNLEEKLHLLIINALPIEAMLKTRGINPFSVYSKMIDLAATLIALTQSDILPEIPAYDHENIHDTFYMLQMFITRGLDKIIDTSSSVPFMRENDMFFLKIEESWLDEEKNKIVIGIRKSSGATYDQFVHWVNGLQIASRPFVSELVQRRVLGASRKIETNMDIITTVSDNIINLSIDPHSSYISLGEELCIFNSSDSIASDEIVLFIGDGNR